MTLVFLTHKLRGEYIVQIYEYLKELYPTNYISTYNSILLLIDKYSTQKPVYQVPLSEKDSILITYGDSLNQNGVKPLKTFLKFAEKYLKGNVSAIHFLPIYPYSSDDGFSVIDYRKVNDNFGTWNDVDAICKAGFDLMLDAVVNHTSKSSIYVQEYLKGNEAFKEFLVESDPNFDYSQVIRPRTSPLLHPYLHKEGIKHLWTTFSEDQLDLNFKNPNVLLEVLDILLFYASHGSRFIRLDAIGVIWKELGSKCMHLPQTHMLIKIMRFVLESCFEAKIITETNVQHIDNISYFGNGSDEAALVYQFSLPPLTMYSFLGQDTTPLTQWAKQLDHQMENTAFFNFLASHDGIGIRPVESLLNDDQRSLLVEHTLKSGGKINYRSLPDKTIAPYELNINYLDAIVDSKDDLATKARKFIAAESIMLSLAGVPGIYIHSLLGSENDYKGLAESNINRRINREKLNVEEVIRALADKNTIRHQVFSSLTRLLRIRSNQKAFNPHAFQQINDFGKSIFALQRRTEEEQISYFLNVTDRVVQIPIHSTGYDLVSDTTIESPIYDLMPYQFIWLKNKI